MGLSVKEKEHWRNRIEARIEKKIEMLAFSASPNYFKNVELKARETTAKKLGVDKIDHRISELKKEMSRLSEQKTSIITGLSKTKLQVLPEWKRELQADSAFEKLVESNRNSILALDKTGQKILELETEKEGLLDTVWLATSPSQIRDLWASVSNLLQEDETELQVSAMKTEPMVDSKP